MPPPDSVPDAPNALPASELLRRAERLLGSGGMGPDTPMARLAEQAAQRARDTGDTETEALAQFYALLGLVGAMPQDELMPRLDAARALCARLGVPRALWLLDDLEAAICMYDGRHMATIAICQRLDRLPPEARPAFERSVSVYYLSFAHQWLGHYDDTLRLRFRLLQLAEQSGSPLWIASACICLGAFLTQEMLDPEKGLPYLQRARAIWAAHEMTDITLVATTQTIVALDMLGRHEEAFAVFAEDTDRDGAMARVDPQRARLTLALLGVGRLDEAQAWLDALPPRYLTVAKDGFPIAPLMRLRLLCAQRRYAEARALAEAERDRAVIHMRSTYDRVQLLDHLRQACEALGDTPAAAEAALAAREACLPLVNLSARARYLAEQLERDPATAPPLSAVDERRLEAIAREVQAQSSKAAAPQVPRFLAHVVHELRNPIGGVMGMSSLLLMSNLDEKQRRFTSAISSSASTLQRLIDDVLDLAKIERGQFLLNPQPFALAPWLDEATAAYVAQGHAKGVVVSTQLDFGLPTDVVGDALRLRQVLVNFLSNALKFTRKGRVEVAVRRLGGATAADATRLRFEVRDTGTGISEDALKRLFREFVQADETIAQDYGGTGLGLALCKQLVETMGGRIGASSEKGVGSVFWFELDLAHAPQALRTTAEIGQD
ncbi:MAG: HAMP domain-containing sensor histidine kinase [Pseudomonadota bacterium]